MPERGRENGVLDDDGCVASLASSRSCYVPRDHERKARREIANSNERRRMQSINAGFQSLRKMLQPRDGDKLSKASVLQKAVEYIYALERDRNCLLTCNARLMCRLRAALGRDACDLESVDDLEFCDFTSAAKRHKMDIESSDEGIGGMLSPPRCDASETMSTDGRIVDGLRRQVSELQRQLDSERKSRMIDMVTSRSHRDHRPAATNSATLPGGVPPRRGSLETIVEAIRCLEGTPSSMMATPTSVLTAGNTELRSASLLDTDVTSTVAEIHRSQIDGEELVVAAAEALQFIAAVTLPAAYMPGRRGNGSDRYYPANGTVAGDVVFFSR